jgi:predicted amidohydrolase
MRSARPPTRSNLLPNATDKDVPMPAMAAAQYCSVKGDIAANVASHLRVMQRAGEHGVGFLLFPELSLTGYELPLAGALAQPANSELLQPLRDFACEAAMTTVVGLPLRADDGGEPWIAALVLGADGTQAVYTKQYLHDGEGQYVQAGAGGSLVQTGAGKLALCVCADFSCAAHAANAAAAGAQVYAASVLIGDGGYDHDAGLLSGYARDHRMAVLMANHGGPTGGWQAAGRSAFWDAEGRLVGALEGRGDQLLVVSKPAGQWLAAGFAV